MCQFYDKAKISKLFECVSTISLIFRIFDSVSIPPVAAHEIMRKVLCGFI